MLVHINGETQQIPDGITIADLIEEMQLGNRRLAIEINGEILPRSEYARRTLHTDDKLEIVHAIGGGQYRDHE